MTLLRQPVVQCAPQSASGRGNPSRKRSKSTLEKVEHDRKSKGARLLSPAKSTLLSEALQRRIVSGQYPPGARLRQERLAIEFGVAQGVVRESLIHLRSCGLVNAFDRRGAYVAPIDRNLLLEAFEVRMMHEALAVRRCCDRASRQSIGDLLEVAHRIYDFAAAGNVARMHDLDRALHGRLVELSGNSVLTRLADQYWLLINSMPDQRDAGIVRDEHVAILQSIEAARADDAEHYIRGHIAAAAKAALPPG